MSQRLYWEAVLLQAEGTSLLSRPIVPNGAGPLARPRTRLREALSTICRKLADVRSFRMAANHTAITNAR
jgi:transposase